MKRRYKLELSLFSIFHSAMHTLCVDFAICVSSFFKINFLHIISNQTISAANALAHPFLPLQRHGVTVVPIFGNNGSVSSLQNIAV